MLLPTGLDWPLAPAILATEIAVLKGLGSLSCTIKSLADDPEVNLGVLFASSEQ